MNDPHIIILGIGSLLYSDDGFGIHVIRRLNQRYEFPDHVDVVDGGVLGFSLLGLMTEADLLIVVDAVRNHGIPGDLSRLEGGQVPNWLRAKTSLHQVEFLELLTLCGLLGQIPETVIIGVEPKDTTRPGTELTPEIRSKIDPAIELVLKELDRKGVCYRKGRSDHVSCHSLEGTDRRRP